MSDPAQQPVIDLAFDLIGTTIPLDYHYRLWKALKPMLPWISEEPGGGIVGIGLVKTGTEDALLSHRSRLTLRVPRNRVGAASDLVGFHFRLGIDDLKIGAVHERPLKASPTLYAPLVVLDEPDELRFTSTLMERLDSLGTPCKPILGRRRSLRLALDAIDAFPVALQGCNADQSLRIQALGLGNRRRLGCGVFVPHKKIEYIE